MTLVSLPYEEHYHSKIRILLTEMRSTRKHLCSLMTILVDAKEKKNQSVHIRLPSSMQRLGSRADSWILRARST